MRQATKILHNALLSAIHHHTLRPPCQIPKSLNWLYIKQLQARSFVRSTRLPPVPPATRSTTTFRSSPSTLLRRIRYPRQARNSSTKAPAESPVHASSASSASVAEQNLSLSQRLRKLSREYGWSALGVYLLLTALDFPFCFLAVRWLGTERVGHWEHLIVEGFWQLVYLPFPEKSAARNRAAAAEKEGGGWGVEEAEVASKKSDATIWTQLALAYAIHKSFIFIRVPLTATLTPRVVKVLRGWGWDIGKRPMRPKAGGGSVSNID